MWINLWITIDITYNVCYCQYEFEILAQEKGDDIMTYAEVQKAITDLVANPDTAQTQAVDLLDKIKGDYETMDSLNATNSKNEERIRTLQDTNQRLFLMTTGTVKEQTTEDQLTGLEAVDAFVNNLMQDNDNNA